MIIIPEQAVDIPDDCPVRTEHVSSNDKPLPVSSSTNHCHVPDDTVDDGAQKRLLIVLILCIIFMIIEIIGMCFCVGFNEKVIFIYLGGFLSNSTAVLTDAAHLGIDAASFLISLAAIYLGRKRPTQQLSFGYFRAGFLFYLFNRI
jgi:Co/Zn/Cd efflux system component